MEKSSIAKILSFLFLFPAIGFGASQGICSQGFYLAATGSLLEGTFNNKYPDNFDVIPQNIAETIQAKGYAAGISLGYNYPISQYILGVELSGNLSNALAEFDSGASTSAFTDKMKIKNWIDLTFNPGICLTPCLVAYLKLGISEAYITDNLNSPQGFDPTYYNVNSSKRTLGIAAGLGIKKQLTNCFSIFTEYNYHDYRNISWPQFTNFSANYSHYSKLYTQNITLGVAYQFA